VRDETIRTLRTLPEVQHNYKYRLNNYYIPNSQVDNLHNIWYIYHLDYTCNNYLDMVNNKLLNYITILPEK
jgi:hypothetical protein